jgi:hypothetical protein
MFFSATSVLAAAVVLNAASSIAAVVPIADSTAVAREVTPDVEVREVPADLLVAREELDSELLTREDADEDLLAREEATDVEARGWHHKHLAKEPAPVVHDVKKFQHTQPKFLVTGRVKKWHRVHKWKHVFAAAHGINKHNQHNKQYLKNNNQQLIVTVFKYGQPGKHYSVTNQNQWEKLLKAAKGHPLLVSTVNPVPNAHPANNNKKWTPPARGKREFEDDMEMFTRDFEDDGDMFAREFDDDVYTRSYESIADLD